MLCPECGNNHRRGRDGSSCSHCRYQFILDSSTHGINDAAFKKLLTMTSADGTYYFTKEQLFANYCRRAFKKEKSNAIGCIVFGGIVLVIGGLVTVNASVVGGIAVAVVAAAFILFGLLTRVRAPMPDAAKFESVLTRWTGRQKIDHLITEPQLHKPPPEWKEPDIYDYGVERILIVQRDLLVDWLVLNGFHKEQNSLVISESGYPGYMATHVRRILAEQPDTPVAILHDSTPEGLGMEQRVIASGMLPEGKEIQDLGLTPGAVQHMPGMAAMRPETREYGVPVDYLMYGTLAGGMAAAFIAETTLEQMVVGSFGATDPRGNWGVGYHQSFG